MVSVLEVHSRLVLQSRDSTRWRFQRLLTIRRPPMFVTCSALNADINAGGGGQKSSRTRSVAQTIFCRSPCGTQWFGTVIWLSQKVRSEPSNTIICSAWWCTSRSWTCSHLLARWVRFTRLLVVVLGSFRKVQLSRVRGRGTVASGIAAEIAHVVIRPLGGHIGAALKV